MRAFTPAELLTVWERGLAEPPARRALALLAPVCDGESAAELAELPIGRRDARLLTARELTFGSRLSGLADCPACAAAVEMEFDVAALRVGEDSHAQNAGAALRIEHPTGTVTFRLPNTDDCGALAGVTSEEEARALLLERCVLTRPVTEGVSPDADLSLELATAISARMRDADPQAEIEIDLACPECGHRWSAPFDIASYFWNELAACAQRLVHEVHALASAYGWSEAEILALSPARRGAYLQMIST